MVRPTQLEPATHWLVASRAVEIDGFRQSTYCSSVDPWHEARDLDEKAGEQVGFDRFFTSGITRGLPAMIPIAMLYSTPEDAVVATVFGKAEYQWHPNTDGGTADPDGPPATTTIEAGPHTPFLLPPASIIVLRGKVAIAR